jgi:chromate transporter
VPRGQAEAGRRGSPLEVLLVATRLGLTSFGGPVAHLGYFRDEYVVRRRWLDDTAYTDLVALSQFLPGPASSKVGIALGIIRAGLLGGLAAWIGFTLPSAILLTLFAYGVVEVGNGDAGWLHGLKVVAVAVVAQAVWGMARSLCPDRPRITLALVSTVLVFAWPALGMPIALSQIVVIVLGAIVGWWALAPPPAPALAAPAPAPATASAASATTPAASTAAPAGARPSATVASPTNTTTPAARSLQIPIGHRLAVSAWVLLVGLLIALPLLRSATRDPTVALVDSFYRSGALVFGGGHVVLPLLRAEVVPPGWVTDEQFLAGYGAAQAVPGPLFTFAAYLGAARGVEPNGWPGATIALVAIFLPAFLLVIGSLPYWERLRGRTDAQAILRGVNASVVGLLLAALYDPVWTSAILRPADFCLGLVLFGLLVFWKLPPWLVVVLAALGGAALAHVG